VWRSLSPLVPSLTALLLASSGGAALYTWVDDEGRTHVTDDLQAVPPEARERVVSEGAGLEELWDDGLRGPPVAAEPGASSAAEDRVVRLLRGAVDDLRRGEAARARVALESVLALEPGRAEAHWYLALLERARGHFGAAEAHLRSFLDGAGEDLEPWRASARRRLAELEDERRLADPDAAPGPLRMRESASRHFRIRYDASLAEARAGYVDRVAGYLEEARSRLGSWLGVYPAEPVHVLLYGKAAYLRAHGHRFSFRTVGFFDGRIHVVSAAHPAGELRALLHHEYTHALFRERVGSDRPLWLNEGLAEVAERRSRGLPPLSRAERFALRKQIASGAWIPLARLERGFGGLDDARARIAYLEATAAVAWLDAHTDARARGRLLALLGRGREVDAALEAVADRDTAGLEAALQQEIRGAFPAVLPGAPAP